MRNITTIFKIGVWVVLSCAMFVSFSHTIALFRTVGIAGGFDWLNHWLGVNWIGAELFATIAAEVAFIMGVLGLLDSHVNGVKARWKTHWQELILFFVGLLVVAWSNIGATVGYDFLIGQPVKGIILGILIPFFIFGAESVLSKAYIVYMKRKSNAHADTQTGSFEDINAQTQRITYEDVHKYSYAQAQNDAHAHVSVGAQIISGSSAHVNAHAHTAQDLSAQMQELESAHAQSTYVQNVQVDLQKESAQNEVAQNRRAQTLGAQIEENAHRSAHTQNEDVQVGTQGSNAQIEQLAQNKQKENVQSAHAQNSDAQNICAQSAHDEQCAHAQKESAHEQASAQINEGAHEESAHAQEIHEQNEVAQILDAQDIDEKYSKIIEQEVKEEIRTAMIQAIDYKKTHKTFPTINELAQMAGVSAWFARCALNKLEGKPTRKRKLKKTG